MDLILVVLKPTAKLLTLILHQPFQQYDSRLNNEDPSMESCGIVAA